MKPCVGMTVQFFEHGSDEPLAAIISAVRGHEGAVALVVWRYTGWSDEEWVSLKDGSPAYGRDQWAPIPAS